MVHKTILLVEDNPDDENEVAVNAEEDTWQRVRNGFDLPDVKHKRIDQELNWFKRHPEYIKRVVERARPYLHFIIEEVEKGGGLSREFFQVLLDGLKESLNFIPTNIYNNGLHFQNYFSWFHPFVIS